jgi:hypothetical protein
MGPAQADRALDNPNLALRVGYRSSRLLDALQMVPSAGSVAVASWATPPAFKDHCHASHREAATVALLKILRSTTI